MRGNFAISLAMACLLGAALTGCVSTRVIDDASSPGDRFGLVATVPIGGYGSRATSATAKTTAASIANPSDAADMDAAVALVEGIPYVRSEPHKVPPFPLVLNQTVQRYVDAFTHPTDGIQETYHLS